MFHVKQILEEMVKIDPNQLYNMVMSNPQLSSLVNNMAQYTNMQNQYKNMQQPQIQQPLQYQQPQLQQPINNMQPIGQIQPQQQQIQQPVISMQQQAEQAIKELFNGLNTLNVKLDSLLAKNEELSKKIEENKCTGACAIKPEEKPKTK